MARGFPVSNWFWFFPKYGIQQLSNTSGDGNDGNDGNDENDENDGISKQWIQIKCSGEKNHCSVSVPPRHHQCSPRQSHSQWRPTSCHAAPWEYSLVTWSSQPPDIQWARSQASGQDGRSYWNSHGYGHDHDLHPSSASCPCWLRKNLIQTALDPNFQSEFFRIHRAMWLVMGWSPQILTVLTILWCKPTRGNTDAQKTQDPSFLWAKEQRKATEQTFPSSWPHKTSAV